MPVFRLIALLGLAMLQVLPALAQAPDRKDTGRSGLPLPRFASLAHNEANLRTGPGSDYPIRWVYKRAGVPVRIIDELDDWRLVQDPDGEQGWALARLLSTKRTVIVRGSTQDLRRLASDGSRVLLRAEPGVIAGFLGCEGAWCQVEIEQQRGWLRRDALWGVLDTEGR